MRLPNAENAFVDIRKLRDYCLDPAHPRGQHKARVFLSSLGFSAAHSDALRDALLEAARTQDASLIDEDDYGRRYLVECWLAGPFGPAKVRSFWLVRRAEDFPRLVTCYVV